MPQRSHTSWASAWGCREEGWAWATQSCTSQFVRSVSFPFVDAPPILFLLRESRRVNGNLRTTRPDDVLASLLMPNGVISERFPKDLKGLFSLDGKSNGCLDPIHLLIDNPSQPKSGYGQGSHGRLQIGKPIQQQQGSEPESVHAVLWSSISIGGMTFLLHLQPLTEWLIHKPCLSTGSPCYSCRHDWEGPVKAMDF